MALGGLMSFLKDVAVSPVGQIAGGAMEQKVTDWQEEARIKEEADARKAQFADALALKKAELGLVDDADAIERENAYTHFADAGVNEKILAEMKRAGWFLRAQNSSEGVYNTLIGAEAFYGKDFWRNPESKGWKAIMEMDVSEAVQPIDAKSTTQIDGVGENTKNLLLTDDSAEVHPDVKVLPKKTGITAESFYTKELVGVKGEEVRKEKALADADFLTNLGYKDVESHFKENQFGDLVFNWQTYTAANPEAANDRNLFNTAVDNVWGALTAGQGEMSGYGDLEKQFAYGTEINDSGLVRAIGGVVSNVIKASEREGQANWFLNRIRKNIEKNYDPKNPIGMREGSNREIIEMLTSSNANWLNELIAIQGKDNEILKGYMNGTISLGEYENPFKDTPFEHIFSDSKNIPIIWDQVLGDETTSTERAEILDQLGQSHQDKELYNERDPLTYSRIQELHNKYYGERATKIIERGRVYEPDVSEKMPIPPGIQTARTYSPKPSSAFLQGVTPSGIMADVKSISALDDIINFKRNNIFNIEEYRPIEGLGETASVLLHGTDLNSLDALKTLESGLRTIPEFEREIQLVLRQQQQDGRLPKDLTQEDIEILTTRTIDDYFYAINERMFNRVEAPDGGDTGKALPGLDEKEFIDSDAETPPSKIKEEGDKPWLLEDGSFNPKFSNTLTTSSNFKEEWEEEGFDFSEYKKAREDWSEGKTKENLDWIVTGIKDLFKSGEASAAENPRFKETK